MPFDEHMADRVRELIAERSENVYEQKMFGGLCFMVDSKICVGVKSHEVLVRIAPDVYEQVVGQDGIRTMSNSHHTMIGYVYVDFDLLRNEKQLRHWVTLALDFNPLAKSSKKKSF